jgi:glutamate synthase domain-containing protein 3
MTGGTVVVLGETGRNFAAGMSGGVAYVYDADGQFASRCNTSMVNLERVLPPAVQAASTDRAMWHKGKDGTPESDDAILKKLIEDHHKWTGSLQARQLLDQWELSRAKFVKVFPIEYKRALAEMALKAAQQTTAHEAVAASAASTPVKTPEKKTKVSPAK